MPDPTKDFLQSYYKQMPIYGKQYYFNKMKSLQQKSKIISYDKINKKLYSPPPLVLSSLFFITNMLTAYINEYYVYSFLFFIITITSVIVHYNDNFYTNIIDKAAVLSIVLYGGYMLYNKINTNKLLNLSVIIITFLICIYLYVYGFIIKDYCFCNEKCVSQKYHFIMHVISSIGHHFIIYL